MYENTLHQIHVMWCTTPLTLACIWHMCALEFSEVQMHLQMQLKHYRHVIIHLFSIFVCNIKLCTCCIFFPFQWVWRP